MSSILLPNGENSDGTAPSRATLKQLFKSLPTYFKEQKKKQEHAAALKATHATLPRKVCKICCVAFDLAFIEKSTRVEAAVCADCQAKLDDGHIAFIEGLRYAFVKPTNNKLADMCGKIVPISTETMDAIQKRQASEQ